MVSSNLLSDVNNFLKNRNHMKINFKKFFFYVSSRYFKIFKKLMETSRKNNHRFIINFIVSLRFFFNYLQFIIYKMYYSKVEKINIYREIIKKPCMQKD